MIKLKKLRLAHIAGGLTFGGVESVILNYFSHIDLSDYELTYISYDTPDSVMRERFEKLGFEIFQVTKKRDNIVKSCIEVYKIFRKRKINIVHSHMNMMCFVTSAIGLLAGVKVRIAHSHIAQNPKGLYKLQSGVFKLFNIVFSTDYFACGPAAAVYLFGQKRLSRGEVTIIKNVVEQSKFTFNHSVRAEVREKLDIRGKFCVGHSGRFTEQKNHAFLLRIFAEIHAREPESVLLLAGTGPDENYIKELSREYRLSERIIFLGAANAMEQHYNAMDVFLLPSLYEGFPMVVAEASESGLPVIASNRIDSGILELGQVTLLPLEVSPAVWAEKALDFRQNTAKRQSKISPCSLAAEAAKLDAYYRNAVNPPRKTRQGW